jgi:hypothetical protein
MKRLSFSRRIGVIRASALPWALAATVGVFGNWQLARAQSPIIAIGPPSFQTLAGPSLEDEILYRLSFLGPREPGDLVQLARLAELRSIATLASIQGDLRGSVTDVQLERENFALWNATDAFDQAVRYLPEDVQNLAWSSLVLNDVEGSFGRMHSSLGGLPALSPRGAFYLEGISQILPFAEDGLNVIAAEIIPAPQFPTVRRIDFVELREQTRLLARDLADLIGAIKGSKVSQGERDTAVAELSRLAELLSGFDRMLVLEPALPVVVDSFRALRRGAQPVETTLIRKGSAAAWRPLRDRLRAISDGLQLPRAIGSLAPERPISPRAAALLPVIDEAGSLVTAVLGQPQAADGNEASSSTIGANARRMQLMLLEFRQHVLVADSMDELGPALREIEALSQQMVAGAQPGPALFRGGRRQGPYDFGDVHRKISRLRGLVADLGKG